MPTQKVVADKTNKLKRSNFDMGHDVNATASFGEVFPLSAQFLHQPSHSHFKVDSVCRMFPLVAPTFGRVAIKTTTNFIGLSEVFPKWKNVLGNKVSLMFNSQLDSDAKWQQTSLKCFPRITPHSLFFVLGNSEGLVERIPNTCSHPTTSVPENLSFLSSSAGWTQTDGGRRLTWYRTIFNGASNQRYIEFMKDLDLLRPAGSNQNRFFSGEADFKVLNSENVSGGTTRFYYGLFRLTGKGKRVKKILDGLGYNYSPKISSSNPNDQLKMSLLPLLAWYRAYFINHMLPLGNYVDWEDTACYKLIESCSHISTNNPDFNGFDFDITAHDNTTLSPIEKERISLLFEFFEKELSMCVWTDDTLESACLNNNMVDRHMSHNPFFHLRSNLDTNYINANDKLVPSGTTEFANSYDLTYKADVSSQWFPYGLSSLDIETLKQMYLYVNRQTLEGSNIEKELIARGYEDYVKDCHCRYLGSTSSIIEITEITSTSDTFKTNADGSYDGRCLAEPAGRGVGYDDQHYYDFDNNEPGFMFTSVAVVPISKGIQNIDMSLLMTDIESYYSPEFDGLGYEPLPQAYLSYINDVTDLTSGDNENPSSTFGLLPRYAGIKTRKNVAIGGFRNYRELTSYGAYTLDSYMLRNVAAHLENNGQEVLPYTVGVGPNNGSGSVVEYLIPSSGRYWMQTLISSWFGNLDRIFNERSFRWFDPAQNDPHGHWGDHGESASVAYTRESSYLDTFMIHAVVDYRLTTRMLPSSLSWGCSSDDNGDKIDL